MSDNSKTNDAASDDKNGHVLLALFRPGVDTKALAEEINRKAAELRQRQAEER